MGITTPVLTMLPDAHARWEQEGTIDDVVAVAEVADRLGYPHLTCSEHVVIPTDVAAVRGSRYWDPLATFGYLAAFTTRIRLATNVLVLGYHHPLEIAKRYGTLDQVCKGRLVLGLGSGPAGGVRPARCPVRRPRAPGRRGDRRPPGLPLRTRAPASRAATTATGTW